MRKKDNFVFEYPRCKYRKAVFKNEPWFGKYVCRVFKVPSAIENGGSGRGYLVINTEKLRGRSCSVKFFDTMPHTGEIIYVDGERCKSLFFSKNSLYHEKRGD